MNRITTIWIVYLFAFLQLVTGQSTDAFPKRFPSYSEDFSNYNSHPSLCFEKAFWDKKGKMWLMTCGAARRTNGIHLFQFDGYDFKFVQDELEQLTSDMEILGLYQEQTLAGYAKDVDESRLFFFDMQTEQLRFYKLPEGGEIRLAVLTGINRIYLIVEKEGKLVFYKWADDQLTKQGIFTLPFLEDDQAPVSFQEIFLLNEEEVWVRGTGQNYVLRINKKTAATQRIYFVDTPGGVRIENLAQQFGPRIDWENRHLDSLYFSLHRGKDTELFKYNPTNNYFEAVKGIPQNWKIFNVSTDKSGNLIFLFLNKKNEYKAILEDAQGKRFDYSAFFEKLNGTKVFYTQSTNFKEQILICTEQGFLLHRVKDAEAIQHHLSGYSIRAMAELPNQQYVISTQSKGSFLLDESTGSTAPLVVPGCYFESTNMRTRFSPDAEGIIWSHSHHIIIRHDPVSNTCVTYRFEPERVYLYTFIGKDQLAVLTTKRNLFLYDLLTQKASPFPSLENQKRFSGFVHDIYYDTNGWLWVATSNGLWKINPKTKAIEVLGTEAPFRSTRFLCIHPDEQNRLWLGTTLGGLYIFDPQSGAVQTLNSELGLGNNTVASIIADADGDRWLGTYNGISIVNPNGELLSNLNLADGLVEKENNRYAYLKAKNGKLLIGTINGLHLIDPQKVKEQLSRSENLNIYLTAVEFYDSRQKKNQRQTYHLNQLETIQLPASKRFLNLSFALSNYFKPTENQFAYMLEGVDGDWTYLGKQRILSLTNLPPGKYRLLLKGSDPLGHWTSTPLAISIHAKVFFYKTAWFYLLMLLLLSSIAFLWIQRLRLEVKRATQKIQKDKELIEHQAAQLKKIDKAKSRFFTNISHEFRTPLTVISGMVDRLKTNPDEWLEKGSNLIKRNTRNLLNLINQILDLRKLESGKLQLNLIQGDVVPYLQYIFESFHSFAKSKQIQLHFLCEDQEIIMDYDPEKLIRILSNLLSNAIKFTEAGGDVYVMVRGQETGVRGQETGVRGQVLTERSRSQGAGDEERGASHQPPALIIQVKDTGIGIPTEQLPHVFNQFYQVDNSSTRQGEGTGVGLSLCKELVKLLGGQIRVDSEVHKGSAFTVTLPITRKAPLSEEAQKLEQLDPAPGLIAPGLADSLETSIIGSTSSEQPLALLVEDNVDVVQYLVACLSNQYQLMIAKDGQEGIDKAIELIPDIIVSDVMMPKKDGFELCQTLKNDERTSHIPIILLTAKADFDSRMSGLQKGADDYLTKPFNEEELSVRIKNLLNTRRKLQLYFQQAELLSEHAEKDLQQEDAFLQKIRALVTDNIDQTDFGISEICRAIGMSRAQLHRKLTALTGQSASHFIRTIRLKRAKVLLQTTDLNVSEVAYEVGFRDPSYFSRLFAEAFGVRPNETRK